jgi:hypothetical protein
MGIVGAPPILRLLTLSVKRFRKTQDDKLSALAAAAICMAGPPKILPNNDEFSHRRNKRTAIAPRLHLQDMGLRSVSIGQCSIKCIDARRLS